MLETVLQEREGGRFQGRVRHHATPLRPWRAPDAAASVAFAIVSVGNEGQVNCQRGEDWRRSLHRHGQTPP